MTPNPGTFQVNVLSGFQNIGVEDNKHIMVEIMLVWHKSRLFSNKPCY